MLSFTLRRRHPVERVAHRCLSKLGGWGREPANSSPVWTILGFNESLLQNKKELRMQFSAEALRSVLGTATKKEKEKGGKEGRNVAGRGTSLGTPSLGWSFPHIYQCVGHWAADKGHSLQLSATEEPIRITLGLGVVVHVCVPRTSEGWGRRIFLLSQLGSWDRHLYCSVIKMRTVVIKWHKTQAHTREINMLLCWHFQHIWLQMLDVA